jgi:hypothetical protein
VLRGAVCATGQRYLLVHRATPKQERQEIGMDNVLCKTRSPRLRLMLLLAFAIPTISLLVWLSQRRADIDMTGLGGMLHEIKH